MDTVIKVSDESAFAKLRSQTKERHWHEISIAAGTYTHTSIPVPLQRENRSLVARYLEPRFMKELEDRVWISCSRELCTLARAAQWQGNLRRYREAEWHSGHCIYTIYSNWNQRN